MNAASAQWDTQSPVPTSLEVHGVGAPLPDRVFIGTANNGFDEGGALFESPDGGATWIRRDVPADLFSGLNGLFFLDSENGWAFGNLNYRTTDGGTTWVELPPLGSTYFMQFYTATFGLATGNFGRYVSGDGGFSWTPSPNDAFAFSFADGLLGLAAATTGLYRSTDGGATFAPVLAGEAAAVAVLSATAAVGIVDGSFVISTDGGETFSPGAEAAGRDRLTAVSPDVVLAWGRSGSFPDYDDRLLRSADGGATWSDLGEVVPDGFLAITVVGPQTLVAADLGGDMYSSADAGQTWLPTFSAPGPAPGFLSSAVPVFADSQTGYFGYGPGFVIKTVDGGASWFQISSGTGHSLRDVALLPAGNLIAVGAAGTVLTSDGGVPWTLRAPPTTLQLEAVQALTDQDVVTVDAAGQVFASTDGGASWTAFPASPANLAAKDLHFKSLQDGWLTGNGPVGGALYHTTDGGASWTAVPDFGGAYVAVDFADASGWAANVSGRYYRSSDGGATWQQGDLPGSSLQIADMDFFDASIGYAVGWWGYAARSDDGGATWQTLPTPSTDDKLSDIHLLGPDELWVSTFDGVAYYSATGGQSWSVLDVGSAGPGAFAAIVALADGDAWTVGDQGFIEHFTGPPPPPENQAPQASFDFTPSGLTVDFVDTSFDPDGVISAWAWDFGDSTVSAEQHPTHTFPEADTYVVRLTVTDDDGATDDAVRVVVVQPGPGGTFGAFTEVTPLDPLFVTPQDEDFWVTATAPADFDGDDDLDIAVFGFYVVYNESAEDRLVLVRNHGQAGPEEWEFSYIDLPLDGLYSGTSDLAWGDIDGDADQDLVVGSEGRTVIFRNDGGTLVPTGTVLPGYLEDNDQADFDLRSITLADYDNDSDLDLLLPSVWDGDTFAYRTALLRNDGADAGGDWIFTETDSVFAPTTHAQSAWADYDGDQDLDLLLVNVAPLTDDGFIRRYRNDGGGVFVGEDLLGGLTIEHGEAQWGDYDDDGDLDILVAGHIKEVDGSFTQALRIYRNDDETYVAVEVIECVPCDGWYDLTAATWADYDSDGDMDILLAGTYNSGQQIEGRAWIYANDGGVFVDAGNELPAPRASGSRGGTFSWLDIDGDADLDYFIAGQYFVPGGNGLVESQMHVYRNDVQAQNAAPSPPSDLDAIVQSRNASVLLSWTPGQDDHTPVDALTFDVEVYRDGAPLVVPHRLPQPGNVSAVTQWLLNGLPDGDYTWTVRSVDSSYNGSSAAAGAFTVGVPTAAAESGLPRAFAFAENFPNPFNPATTFRFDLPVPSRVDLSVYDLKGRLVARLADGPLPAGVHVIRWDATGVASGTYFARLTAGRFVRTRSIALVK